MTDLTAYENAVALAQLGFPLFPSDGLWNTGWAVRATSDLALLAAFNHIDPSANWRVRTGREFKLLVLDTRRACDWQELIDTLGKPPRSWAVRRGTAGFHRWFSLSPHDPEPKIATPLLGTHAAFKRSAPVPGSVSHKSGERYDWVPGFDPESIPLARLPDEWIEALPKAGDRITSMIVQRRHEFRPHIADY